MWNGRTEIYHGPRRAVKENVLKRFLAEPDRAAMREERAEVLAFDEGSRSFTVLWRGATVGPVWSANGIRHPAGAEVTVLVKDGLVLRVIP